MDGFTAPSSSQSSALQCGRSSVLPVTQSPTNLSIFTEEVNTIRFKEEGYFVHLVTILDTFEASIANLEAQLELREKQYEYYRNKLLTFE